MRTVTLFTAPGCHLCEQALTSLQAIQQELPFELIQRDITLEQDLHRSYFERIPVVALDGEELSEYFLDEPDLRERLGSDTS